MAKIVVLGTGGTIASEGSADDGAIATRTAAELVAFLPSSDEVVVCDLMTVGSYRLSLSELRGIATAAAAAAAESDVDGVVVTHGTDTMEETAYLTSLIHRGETPIVFTGAQFASDRLSPDGDRNLCDAIAFAGSPLLKGAGVGVAFGGDLRSARGVRKVHSTAPHPFAGGVLLARRAGEQVTSHARVRAEPALLRLDERFDGLIIDMVMSYPGADPALLAFAAERSDAVVLVGTGAGNAAPGFAEQVAEATRAGTPVVLASRVFEGPVVPLYGNGGGVDLVRAGAVSAGELGPSQARMLAAALLGGDVALHGSQPAGTPERFADRFASHAS